MTFLPIVERELRVASRRRGTYAVYLKGAEPIVTFLALLELRKKPDPQIVNNTCTGLGEVGDGYLCPLHGNLLQAALAVEGVASLTHLGAATR